MLEEVSIQNWLPFTSLAKDTAIYGVSSIVGRFLNWLLVPLYTIMFPVEEYGVVTFVYSVIALVLAVLIYGMDSAARYRICSLWR